MPILILLAIAALLLTAGATPVCRTICNRLGWVDFPDTRKTHRAPVPRTGGFAILLGYFSALALFLLAAGKYVHSDVHALSNIRSILPAIVAAFITGILDDLLGLRPWMKIAGQILAAVLACNAGVLIHGIAGYSPAGNWWCYPATIFWLVACSNAFNLIDGLDGLAVGIGLFASVTVCLSALIDGNIALAFVTAPLVGALLGFLPYNFSVATIFMGDCGSNTVGLMLGCFAVIWSQKSATLLGMTAPLIAFAIPLVDTTLSVLRRFLRRQPIFHGDRGHIHHRLLARGFSPLRVVYILYASAGLLAALSLLLTTSGKGGLALVMFCAIVWFAIQYLGYEEFEAVRRVIFGGSFRQSVNTNLAIRKMEQAIGSAKSLDECWTAVMDSSDAFGLSTATLHYGGKRLTAIFSDNDPRQCWSLKIPLNDFGSLDLLLPFGPPAGSASIDRMVPALRAALLPKLESLLPLPTRCEDLPADALECLPNTEEDTAQRLSRAAVDFDSVVEP